MPAWIVTHGRPVPAQTERAVTTLRHVGQTSGAGKVLSAESTGVVPLSTYFFTGLLGLRPSVHY
jgi:hypothetical protein